MNNNFCDTVITIPQTANTCWFNALLMMIFYSQNSRKLLISNNNFSDKNDELSIIFRAMLYKSYIRNSQIHKYLIQKSPQYILKLLKFEKKIMNGNIIKNFNYGFTIYYYINTFLKHLNLEYLSLSSFNLNDNKFYVDINELFQFKYNKKQTYSIIVDYNNLLDINIKKEFLKKINEKIKNEIPKYIIINLNDSKNSFKTLKKNIHLIQDFIFDNNMIKNLNQLPNEIEYKGYSYILDSVGLDNYNNLNGPKHTICGITCKNKRYIYNGWMKKTIDPLIPTNVKLNNSYPCELMSFNWNIHETNNFCLNISKCKLDKVLNPKKDLCFSFDKDCRTILYVLKDKNFISLDYNVSSPYINEINKKSKKEIKKEIKECPENKILNPLTKRCVLKSSKIGKALLLKMNENHNDNHKDEKKEIKKEIKECPKDKIYNPETKRCVLKSGKIGKLLLSKLK